METVLPVQLLASQRKAHGCINLWEQALTRLDVRGRALVQAPTLLQDRRAVKLSLQQPRPAQTVLMAIVYLWMATFVQAALKILAWR